MFNDLPPLSGPVDAITATVGEVRDAEHDGPLESTDLHVEGRGLSLLVNVLAGQRFTFALSVDGVTRQSGTVGGPVDASGEPDYTRQFLRKLQLFDWLSSPEVILEHDEAIGFDWLVNGGTVSAHVSATGRAGWAALVGEHKSSGSFQLPDWPEAFTEALRVMEAAAAVPSPPAQEDVRRLVDAQAEDDGLWFHAQTASEAYLQQALRKLHTAIEALPSSPAQEQAKDEEIRRWRKSEQELSSRYVKLRMKLEPFGALDTKLGGEDRFEKTEAALDAALAELSRLRALPPSSPIADITVNDFVCAVGEMTNEDALQRVKELSRAEDARIAAMKDIDDLPPSSPVADKED